jgi:hypothetical protein
MIRKGEIVIPVSADGRTLNIKSINIKDYPNVAGTFNGLELEGLNIAILGNTATQNTTYATMR